MGNLFPVYKHPTLTVLVDDSQSFLDSLVYQLSPHLKINTFSNPQAALDWFEQSSHLGHILVGFDDKDFLDRHNIFDQVYQLVMDRRRFNVPSVLVIDYSMPGMNGVDFCRAIQDFPCKKILLTGQADNKIAIDAFNQKLIDRFIKKNDPEALGQLGNEIIKLQKDFFIEQTHTLKELLPRNSFAFISDPSISAFVEQLCNRYRFVEYYLFPNPPGILFFDAQGKATLMVVETAASLTTHLEIAQDQDAPVELITALREFKLVPFFSDTGGMYLKEIKQQWLSYCLPSEVCRGREDYYWALFDLPPQYLQGPVYSYAESLLD